MDNLNLFYLKAMNRLNKKLFWNSFSKKSMRTLDKSYFILSFDCDTEEDFKVLPTVHAKLADLGILPVYAVPGELLKKGESVYSRIRDTGAEFINHGGRSHTYFDTSNNRYASNFFYDQQSLSVLEDDIQLGHETLLNVLGIQATGWRTPHFGTFQTEENFRFLYMVLKKLKYKFSSSAIPLASYRKGPVYMNEGILEIPVTGFFKEPFNIMDTWSCFAAPDRIKTPKDYYNSCQQLSVLAQTRPLLINIYGDPSHIHSDEVFFQSLKEIVKVSKNINYNQLLGLLNGKICDL